jgi:hypothetical protein
MKISHLVEFTIDEAFNDMSQKATNIAAGKGAATDAEVRQQRIAQLAANQKARNAAPAGKPIAPATAQQAPAATAAPATAQPAATPAPDAATSARIAAAPQGYDTETGQLIGQAPATGTPAPAGAKGAVTGLANTVGAGVAKGVGGLAKGVGAVGGGIAGAFDKIKQGYQAGKGAVGGAPAPAASGGGSAPAGATAADNAEIAQLVNRVSALEKAVGIAESYKFESKFLKMDI